MTERSPPDAHDTDAHDTDDVHRRDDRGDAEDRGARDRRDAGDAGDDPGRVPAQEPAEQPPGYPRARRHAERLAADPVETERVVERAARKAERVRHLSRVRGFWADLTALFRLVRARARGEYRELPWRSLVSALAAIVYFLSPLDVLPDFIPFVGFVDDAAVLAFVLHMIAGDLARFREWEASRAGGAAGDTGATPGGADDGDRA